MTTLVDRALGVFPAGISNGEFGLPPERLVVIVHLGDGMITVPRHRAVTAQVTGNGPLAQEVFSQDPVKDYRSTYRADRAKGRAVMLALFERGVFLNPMGTKLYLSIAHDEALCDRLDDALGAVNSTLAA